MRRIIILILCLMAGIFGLVRVSLPVEAFITATPTPTPEPYRNVEIELLTETTPDSLFEIGEIVALRNHEGFQIWTHQSHFWQPGDFFDASSLDVKVIFDHTQEVEPFIFWRSSNMQNMVDENANLIGRFLSTGMIISVDTSQLDLGEHTMTVRIGTPHDKTFSQSWQFAIRERATPRLETPPEIMPTAEYLSQFPQPTPAFLQRLSTQPLFLDRFSPIGSREGLCLTLDDAPFVPLDLSQNPFRSALWDEITVTVDNILLDDNQIGQSSDSPGHLFLCIDTDFLAAGIHLAEIILTVNDEQLAYQWAFVIE